MKKTSLFDTICYFLMQVESACRICKGRDIAVILTEKRGAVDIFLNLKIRIFYFLFQNAISWLLLNKSDNSKYFFFIPIYN